MFSKQRGFTMYGNIFVKMYKIVQSMYLDIKVSTYYFEYNFNNINRKQITI